MRTVALGTVATAMILLVNSLGASAMPANAATIAPPGKQADPVIAGGEKSFTKRCRADFLRDRYGYCVPSWRG
jgi:hypothetical protein